MKNENKMLALAVFAMLIGIILIAVSQDAKGEEPPDEVVEEMHELVQRTCFDNQDLDPAEKDRCSLYVIRTLRDEYADEQAALEPPAVSAAPPPGSEDSEEPPPAPILTGVTPVEEEL